LAAEGVGVGIDVAIHHGDALKKLYRMHYERGKYSGSVNVSTCLEVRIIYCEFIAGEEMGKREN
jgi:hypothetical protein